MAPAILRGPAMQGNCRAAPMLESSFAAQSFGDCASF